MTPHRTPARAAALLLVVGGLAACQDVPTVPAMDLDPQFTSHEATPVDPVKWGFRVEVAFSKTEGVNVGDVLDGWLAFDRGTPPSSVSETQATYPLVVEWEVLTSNGSFSGVDADVPARVSIPEPFDVGYILYFDPGRNWDLVMQLASTSEGWLSGVELPASPPDVSLAYPRSLDISTNDIYFQGDLVSLWRIASDPAAKDDCKEGGWEAFGFRNQGQCVRFVETGKDSR